jgi:hypothetical protein
MGRWLGQVGDIVNGRLEKKEWAGGVWCGAGPERVLARAQVSFLPFYFLFFIFLYSNLIQIHI